MRTATWICAWSVMAWASLIGNACGEDAMGDVTEITSVRLTFNQEERFALFEENVVVIDPALRLTTDRLTVYFDEHNEARLIEAVGQVVIEQEDTKAWAGKATYDLLSGKLFLEDQPRIKRNRDLLEGDTITFWRDDNKLICEPQARLVLYPEQGDTRDRMLFGE